MQQENYQALPDQPVLVRKGLWPQVLATPTRRLLALSFGMLSLHTLIWTLVVLLRDRSWVELLTGWDSGWYLKIIQEGYTGQAWAFYPGWPLLVKGLGAVPGVSLHPVLLGSLLSTALYGAIVLMFGWLEKNGGGLEQQGLLPGNTWGWFLFVFSPATFAFHSHHTESLYLLLCLIAWNACVRGRWLGAAMACGLAALTKNQGVLLSISCALWMASLDRSPSKKIGKFVLFGLVSGVFFALFPFYQWLKTGDPLRFIHVQDVWHPDISLSAYLKGLVMLNPWQAVSMGTLIHHIFFLVLLAGATLLWKKNRYLSLYVFGFVLVEPLSGELVGTLRYGTVLAPAFFVLGNLVDDRLLRRRPLLYAIPLVWFALNLAVTWNYGIGRWAY